MDIVKIAFDDNYNLVILMHWVILIPIVLIAVIGIMHLLKGKYPFLRNVEIDSAEIGIQGHKVKIRPNHTNIEVAYRIWVELNTRKIGIPIDFDHDCIVEVYNSWYQFFGVTRELIKSLPATKIRNDKDTQELIDVSTKILNEGLRPHLTKWQARFRKWYDNACKRPESDDKCPQQVQEEFPDFAELREDMIRINQHLMTYKEKVYELAFGQNS
ncbi:MAG: hypothetical protein LBH06_02080 [Rikenellaceae bacterium]|jgi:hypothetical protein|nr:hypothetical protein [Rikenellaceae bacterium]